MATLAMFPLGSVLFPHMPLRLRVFEERYLLMLMELFEGADARFGVVLIERGHEVGGGDQRFAVGTVANIVQLGAEDGFVGLVAQGANRFEVVKWLADAPHPRAEVRELPELTWDEAAAGLRTEAEQLVRRTLAVASEFSEGSWSPDVALSQDPLESCWQLAAIAPVNPLDQVSMLSATSVTELLERLIALTNDAAVAFSAPWPEEQDPS
jgi:Lon protease-like protein